MNNTNDSNNLNNLDRLGNLKILLYLCLTLVVAGMCGGAAELWDHYKKFESEKVVIHDMGKFLTFEDQVSLGGYLKQLAQDGNRIFIVTIKKAGSLSDRYINHKLSQNKGKFDSFVLVNLNKKKEIWFSQFKIDGVRGIKIKEFKVLDRDLIGNELRNLLGTEAQLRNLKLTPPVYQQPEKSLATKVRTILGVIGLVVTFLLGIWKIREPWALKQGTLFALSFAVIGVPFYYLPTFFFLGMALNFVIRFRKPLSWRLLNLRG